MTIPAVVRRAHPGDVEALAAVDERTEAETYAGAVPAQVLADHAAQAVRRWSTRLEDPLGPAHWVAVRDDVAVGLAWARAAGPGQPAPLELSAICVVAAEHGSGTGQRLLDISVGDAPCYLWVPRANARALAFFARNGFAPDGATQVQQERGGLTAIRLVR